ncbi:hypothetical protein T484DRAFT_3650356, partial [Baffinella frigidus]
MDIKKNDIRNIDIIYLNKKYRKLKSHIVLKEKIMNNTQTIVSTSIKGMVKQRLHPTSVKLSGKERKVLLENGIDARAFVGTRKQKVIYLNEKVALYMRPALTNAQRQKNFRDKFKAENAGNDYYKVRNEYKFIKGNSNKKFTKEKAEQLVKAKTKVSTKKRYIGTIDVIFIFNKKDTKPYEDLISISFDKVVNEADIDKKAKQLINEYVELNWYLYLVVKSYTRNVIEQTTKNTKDIKMKDRNALNVGVQYVKSELFDKGNGQCVFDFLLYRYGDIKGFINICKDYRMLASQMLPIQHEDEAKMDLEIDDLLKNGVTCEHVMNFCKWHRIHCYALDCMDTTFDIYQPENKNKKAG